MRYLFFLLLPLTSFGQCVSPNIITSSGTIIDKPSGLYEINFINPGEDTAQWVRQTCDYNDLPVKPGARLWIRKFCGEAEVPVDGMDFINFYNRNKNGFWVVSNTVTIK